MLFNGSQLGRGPRMVWVALAGAILMWMTSPAFPQTAILRGQSYTITPKPCLVNGAEGTCMFVWECIKTEGQHVGMCVDQFMFGSCCVHNATENLLVPSLSSSSSSSEPAVLFSPPEPSTVSTSPATTILLPVSSSSLSTSSLHHHTPAASVAFLTRPANVNWGSHQAATGAQVSHPSPASSTSGATAALGSTTVLQFVTKPIGSSTFKPLTTLTVGGNTNTEQDLMTDTAAAGSTAIGSWTLLQTVPGHSWQATTQPSFVTRPRPHPGGGGSSRPRPPQRPRPPHRPARPPVVVFPSATTTTTTRRTTTTTTTAPTTTTTTTTTPRPTSTLPATSTIPPDLVTNGHRDARCGVPPLFPRPETRIVGGKDSPFGGWPWQVSVRRTSFFGFSSTHRCGGALINENWIATAGHCVDDLLTSQIRIRVGEYDFSSVQEPLPFVERSVSRKVVHPKYNFFTYEYDLALVRLESPLQFQQHIAPVCLPASDDLLIGENATVTGWGRLSEGGTLPSVLQEVTVPIVSNDKCKNMFLRAGRHEYIPEIFLCAGYDTGGQDSCQGDSGGPLQVRGKDGRYFLAGIISWGIGCAEANLPGVCTRISKFVPWILEHVT